MEYIHKTWSLCSSLELLLYLYSLPCPHFDLYSRKELYLIFYILRINVVINVSISSISVGMIYIKKKFFYISSNFFLWIRHLFWARLFHYVEFVAFLLHHVALCLHCLTSSSRNFWRHPTL